MTGPFGDPLVTEALIGSAARNSPPVPTPAIPGSLFPLRNGVYANDELPDFDKAGHLAWWQPEVRGHICARELHAGLHFLMTDRKGANPSVGLYCIAPREDTTSRAAAVPKSITLKCLPVVTIQRPSRTVFDAQLAMVLAHARSDQRRARMAEVLTQVLPQVPFWSTLLPLSPWRTPHTYEFIGIVLKFGMEICHRFKHALAVSRPSELSPLVQPILQTPGWSALPSGHATEAFMFVRLISGLLYPDVPAAGVAPVADDAPAVPNLLIDALQVQARSIADNRVYAGLHYPVDGVAGRLLGHTLADYVIARCTGEDWVERSFKASDDLKRRAARRARGVGRSLERDLYRQRAGDGQITREPDPGMHVGARAYRTQGPWLWPMTKERGDELE